MCFKCQGLGDIAQEFANKKVITMAEWATVKEEFEEEEMTCESEPELEETQDEVSEEADEGEFLVLRRVPSNQRGVQDEQRENIFQTRCTV